MGGDNAFVSVEVGAYINCGLDSSGAAHCWGHNFMGGVGNDLTGTYEATPRAVAGGLSFATVSPGYTSSCALTSGGAALRK